MFEVLEELIKTVRERKNASADKSYTKKLLEDKNLCREKVMEEIRELIEALDEQKNQIHEAADVFYHLLALLEANGVKVEDVMQELKKRQGVSGLVEKASRQK
jgi:phosphoribosyl-ATP pyrophosphohydrolase